MPFALPRRHEGTKEHKRLGDSWCLRAFVAIAQPGSSVQRSWVGGVAQSVAEEVPGHHRDKDEDAGRKHPGEIAQVTRILRRRQHVAPARLRLLYADAQE